MGGRIRLYDSSGELTGGDTSLTQATTTASPDSFKWGPVQIVNRAQLIAAIQAYKAQYVDVGALYRWYSYNSNFFVNSVISASGGNPVIPGALAPECVPVCPFGALR